MIQNEKYYACEEHIDLAMEHIIDNERFPEMNLLEEKEKCSFCEEFAKYIVE